MLEIHLKEYLEEHGISITWLSDKTNIRYATLLDIIHKKRNNLNLQYLSKIMKVLNINEPSVIIKMNKN